MNARLRALLVVAVAFGAISCRKAPAAGSPEDRAEHDGNEPAKPIPKMTNMDPKSPEAWKQAEAVAAAVATGPFTKRSDALPFVFMAKSPRTVLVHQGKVVTEKGAAAAGRYLRDLGIIDGKGPGIDDVLYMLHFFDAWPPVKEAPKQAYVTNEDEALAPRIERENGVARVVLHYYVGKPSSTDEQPAATPENYPDDFRENDVGTVAPEAGDAAPVNFRPVARFALEIPPSGEPHWMPEVKFNWTVE